MEIASLYSRWNRPILLLVTAMLIGAIALADWRTAPYISIGFLYLFPIMLVSGLVPRWQIVVIAEICAFLQEAFSNLPPNEAIARLVMASIGFIGTGLFASEIIRNRQRALEHVEEVDTQIKLRREAEEQLRVLVESSPAAIVTIDAQGSILLANEAAKHLFTGGEGPIERRHISDFLPALQAAVGAPSSRTFRTTLQCRGTRSNGEMFLAAVWFSTYTTLLGPRLAAIVVDLSEDLRDREDLSLDHLLKNARILVGAVAHEVRNLCSAVSVVHKNLSRLACLENNEDFSALGTLVEGLERLSAMELQPATDPGGEATDLPSVLDELRVLIDSSYHEAGMQISWEIAENLPLVYGDRYGLQQVFLNLARNSQRAMKSTPTKQLAISSSVTETDVIIRFEDTGVGIGAPGDLFKPFQPGARASGLGLYVSRAILRSFLGEIEYESRNHGCCFAVRLRQVIGDEDASNR